MHTQQGLNMCECAERCFIEKEDVKGMLVFIHFIFLSYQERDILLKFSHVFSLFLMILDRLIIQ